MNKRRLARILKEFCETLAMTAVVFTILVLFVVQGYRVYGSCMEPNLYTGQRLLGNKLTYRFSQPSRGDVIIFRYPRNPSQIFIKRIIGLAGETIEIQRGVVYINGRELDEHLYVRNHPHGDFLPTTVTSGHVFVLGDNRDQSNDSRSWGELPVQNIQAKAWLRYWPVSGASVVR